MGRKGLTWTSEEKELLCKYTAVARKYGESLIGAFDAVSRRLNRPESTIGMYYYNVIRRDKSFSEEEIPALLSDAEEKLILDEISGKKRARQRKPWTEEESRIIQEEVERGLAEGKNLKDVWEHLHEAKMPHRTTGAIARQYYVNIKESSESTPIIEVVEREYNDPILPDVSIPEEIKPIIQKLHTYSQLVQENERLKKEVELLKESLAEMKKQYEDAELLFNMFTNMASISQIMGLGDFKQQMRTQLDKWGNVVKISFEKIS